jgi:hypothetical protein
MEHQLEEYLLELNLKVVPFLQVDKLLQFNLLLLVLNLRINLKVVPFLQFHLLLLILHHLHNLDQALLVVTG